MDGRNGSGIYPEMVAIAPPLALPDGGIVGRIAPQALGAHKGSVTVAEGIDLTEPVLDEPLEAETGPLHRRYWGREATLLVEGDSSPSTP